MEQDKIKQAFAKVKEDILSLQGQINQLKRTLNTFLDGNFDRQTNNSTHNQTIRHINTAQTPPQTTETQNTTHPSTNNYPLEASKTPISSISTGNEGVSTDRQTDRQTDNSTGNEGVKVRFNQETPIIEQNEPITTESQTTPSKIDQLQKVSDIINSLDDIKKDLRQKIKRLTNQEMSVLTTIYQLEEKGLIVDYSILAQTLEITESSIRDYTQRLIKKGLPVDKIKENNKKITLQISQNLKKVAPLSTIMQLREL
jgi:hypothetical protein